MQHVLSSAFLAVSIPGSRQTCEEPISWNNGTDSSMGEQEEFSLRGYIQTLTRLSKPAFEEEGSNIEDWVGHGVGPHST